MPEIPEVGTQHKVEDVKRQHADYAAVALRAQWLRDTYLGTGGYQSYVGRYDVGDGSRIDDLPDYTYLQKYPRESAAKWTRRLESAYYPPWVRRIVAIYSGLILRQPPVMASMPPEIERWTGQGTTGWQTRRAELVPWCCVYPQLFALVDRPQANPDAASAAQVEGADTTVTLLHPDSALDWAYGDDDEIDWLKYASPLSRSLGPMAAPVAGTRYTVLTRDGWWRYDVMADAGSMVPVVAAGEWPDGVRGQVPVAVYHAGSAGDGLGDVAPIEFISRIMRRLYNVSSQKAAIEDLSCFPVLFVPVKSPDDLASLNWAEDSAIPIPADAGQTPAFVGYDVKPLDYMAAEQERLVRALKDAASAAIDQDGGNTGIARAYAFMLTNATLGTLATAIECWEYDILGHVARWEGLADGLPDDATVSYSRKYDLIEAQAAIDGAAALLDLELGPHARVAVKRRALLSAYLYDLPPSELAAIEDELEAEAEGDTEAQEWTGQQDARPEPPPQEPMIGGIMPAPEVVPR